MSQIIDLETLLDYLEKSYFGSMPSQDYDEGVFIGPLRTVVESNNTEEERKHAFVELYKLLRTNNGTNLLRSSKDVTQVFVYMARTLIEKIGAVGDEHLDMILAREISKFSIDNQDIFLEHGISHTLYYGYDYIDEEENIDEEELEYADEDDEEYQAYASYFNTIESVYANREMYDQALLAAIEERERRNAKQEWDNKILLVNEHFHRRNDPFYVAAINCVKTVQKKKDDEWLNENTKQLRLIKNILRREMETGREIVSGQEFSCEYKLVEQYTGVKVVDDFSRKFGCRFSVTYNDVDCSTNVTIFDGVETHEFYVIANIPLMIPRLKNEIRQDIAQCLYDTGFCSDIAGVISEFVW
jgi:hypothetical protein